MSDPYQKDKICGTLFDRPCFCPGCFDDWATNNHLTRVIHRIDNELSFLEEFTEIWSLFIWENFKNEF